MTRRALVLLAVLGFAGPVRAQDQPDIPMLRDQLMALEKDSWEAMKTRNRAAIRRLLPDDCLQIYADGTRYTKSEFLDYMANYRLDDYEIEPTYGLRMISSDTAVLIYRVTSRGRARFDRMNTGKVLATSVYVRRDGKWGSVLYQETPSTTSNLGEKR